MLFCLKALSQGRDLRSQKGLTRKYNIGGCGKLYVTVNTDDYGICEVFTNTGEEGCAALSEALSRLISISIRAGIDLDSIISQVQGIRCITCIADNKTHVLSCPDAIGKAIEFHIKGSNKFDLDYLGGPKSVMICPEEGLRRDHGARRRLLYMQELRFF
jgi:ribonucleoside-diphosphate reductase alpha chain